MSNLTDRWVSKQKREQRRERRPETPTARPTQTFVEHERMLEMHKLVDAATWEALWNAKPGECVGLPVPVTQYISKINGGSGMGK